MLSPMIRSAVRFALAALLLHPTVLHLPAAVAQDAAAPWNLAVEVVFDEATFPEGFRGDLFIAFADPEGSREPRQAMHSWFGAPPVARFSVAYTPGQGPIEVDIPSSRASDVPWSWTLSTAEAFGMASGGEAPGDSTGENDAWNVQAVVRRSPTGREAGLSEGDVHSAPMRVRWDPSSTGEAIRLVLDRVVPAPTFEETERIKLFEMKSELLSAFWGFDYTVRAGVLLPLQYDPEETYPVVYSVTGFGGDHGSIRGWERRAGEGTTLAKCIVVVPDASNRYGHSVFCDSASIGPWGSMLTREMIPALEEHFGGGDPYHRYVTGVSSGGWSSLWLQVAYPEHFSGCWSHVPDPIDFHDFQGIDLYTPIDEKTARNMYVDEAGEARPLARNDGTVMLTYEEFVRREHVLNPGGQIRSFEATFSQPDANGLPSRIFDVATGEIDHAVAATWRNYDISRRLLNDWELLEPVLDGKIRIYAGEVDTFYLEGAVERFRRLAGPAGLLDHMVVDVIPGMAHSLHGPGQDEMLATIEARLLEREPKVPEPPKAPWEQD